MKKVLLLLLAITAIACTETELLTPPNTDPIELKDVDIQAKQFISLKQSKNTAQRTVGSGCLSPSHNTMNDTCTRECQPPSTACSCPPCSHGQESCDPGQCTNEDKDPDCPQHS